MPVSFRKKSTVGQKDNKKDKAIEKDKRSQASPQDKQSISISISSSLSVPYLSYISIPIYK
jgi:hypothetical protein